MKRWLIVMAVTALLLLANPFTWSHPFWSFAFFAAGIVEGMLVIVVHELGHALVGRRAGLRLVWFAAGPVMIDLGGRRRVRRSPLGGLAGGFVAFDVGDLPDEQAARGLRRMSAGGPLTNLGLACLCLV